MGIIIEENLRTVMVTMLLYEWLAAVIQDLRQRFGKGKTGGKCFVKKHPQALLK
jgi:ribosomal protein S24E